MLLSKPGFHSGFPCEKLQNVYYYEKIDSAVFVGFINDRLFVQMGPSSVFELQLNSKVTDNFLSELVHLGEI